MTAQHRRQDAKRARRNYVTAYRMTNGTPNLIHHLFNVTFRFPEPNADVLNIPSLLR